MPRRGRSGLGVVLTVACWTASADRPTAHFDFLYIDANVGTSSGGHVALRLGDEVFHYQHDPEGFAVLARDEWPHFRATYNDLDNRNIHVARVGLAADDLEQVHDHFTRRHLIQARHLDFLAALRGDRELFQQLRAGATPAVPGAGFFAPSRRGAPELAMLNREIAARFGAGFPQRQIDALEERLHARRPAGVDVGPLEVSDLRYPAYPATFARQHLDSLAKLTALRVLAGAWAPSDRAFLDPQHYGVPARERHLAPTERALLQRLRRQLYRAVPDLLDSPRGDGGFPLLLALIRYVAVAKSLALDRLVLVNPYEGLAANIAAADAPQRRRGLELAVPRLAAAFRETRQAFFALEDPDEASLNLLENAAARYFETFRGLRERTSFHLSAGIVVPEAARAVPSPTPALGELESSRAIEPADAAYRAFRAKLEAAYPYQLMARNCATELVRTLNSAFPRVEEVRRALGASLDPDDVSVRVPFRLYERVVARLRTEQRSLLPSYRNRQLGAFAAREHPLWIYLAESNTVTSTLYRPRRGDTRFLLFTEDVAWLRPVYGAVNLGYGLVHAGVGLITAPIDQGEGLREGLRGALFSLPELVFANIRKGSFASTEHP